MSDQNSGLPQGNWPQGNWPQNGGPQSEPQPGGWSQPESQPSEAPQSESPQNEWPQSEPQQNMQPSVGQWQAPVEQPQPSYGAGDPAAQAVPPMGTQPASFEQPQPTYGAAGPASQWMPPAGVPTAYPEQSQAKGPKKKRRWVLPVVITAVLVIVGLVLGWIFLFGNNPKLSVSEVEQKLSGYEIPDVAPIEIVAVCEKGKTDPATAEFCSYDDIGSIPGIEGWVLGSAGEEWAVLEFYALEFKDQDTAKKETDGVSYYFETSLMRMWTGGDLSVGVDSGEVKGARYISQSESGYAVALIQYGNIVFYAQWNTNQARIDAKELAETFVEALK